MNYIWVTHQQEGFHRYSDAPNEVKFLRSLHRHMFKFKIWIEIYHDDREIEFFMFKNFIKTHINYSLCDNKSCEMISNDLYSIIIKKYPKRKIMIEVSEDGENGSMIIYD